MAGVGKCQGDGPPQAAAAGDQRRALSRHGAHPAGWRRAWPSKPRPSGSTSWTTSASGATCRRPCRHRWRS
ncbi:hypothetical protein G6F24_018957 [Rhizopus arrhizus]|nr:hypothetical protein G6F24_018957 [Rhizopus arrhizus]